MSHVLVEGDDSCVGHGGLVGGLIQRVHQLRQKGMIMTTTTTTTSRRLLLACWGQQYS